MKYTPDIKDIVCLPRERAVDRKMYLPCRGDYRQDEMRRRKTTGKLDRLAPALVEIPYWANVLDIGAHIGITVEWFCRVAGASHVTAIEPDEYNASILSANVTLNGLEGIVDVVRAATGRSVGYARLVFSTICNTGTRLFRRCAEDDPRKVPVVTIDKMFPEGSEKIDVVKINACDAYADTIEGATGLLSRDRPVILLEMYGPGTRIIDPNFDTAESFIRTMRTLASLGYFLEKDLGENNGLYLPR